MSLTRRSFLQKSAFTVAAAGLSARTRAASEGANGDIRVAIIGFNGRGQSHIAGYNALKGVRITALCDVDTSVLAKGKDALAKKGHECETYQDIRKLLENK